MNLGDLVKPRGPRWKKDMFGLGVIIDFWFYRSRKQPVVYWSRMKEVKKAFRSKLIFLFDKGQNK